MFLGWDVISRFLWQYSASERFLYVGNPEQTPKRQNLQYDHFPMVVVEHHGQGFRAGIDTGHTETMLDIRWKTRISDFGTHEATVVGLGSERTVSVPYAEHFAFRFEEEVFELQNIDLVEQIYGADGETEALLGADVFAERNWILDYPNRSISFLP